MIEEELTSLRDDLIYLKFSGCDGSDFIRAAFGVETDASGSDIETKGVIGFREKRTETPDERQPAKSKEARIRACPAPRVWNAIITKETVDTGT